MGSNRGGNPEQFNVLTVKPKFPILIMKYVLKLLPLLLLTGCLSPSAKQLPAIIRELAKDTNAITLRITAPAFGTLEFERNMPRK